VGSPYAGHELGCDHLRAPEPHALGALDGESVLRALTDDAPLPLGGRRHHVGHELSGGSGKVDAEVEGDEVPA
jgi:hypothetical protein